MVETMQLDDETIQVRLGMRIRARREKLGLSQSELGEVSGTHRTYVNQVENGRKNVTVGTMARIASALGTTLSALTQGILDAGDDTSD